MGHIKNYDKPIKGYKIWLSLVFIILMICGVGFSFKNLQKPTPQPQYEWNLRISNWVGGQNYQFDYYKKDGNTYKLYNKD